MEWVRPVVHVGSTVTPTTNQGSTQTLMNTLVGYHGLSSTELTADGLGIRSSAT